MTTAIGASETARRKASHLDIVLHDDVHSRVDPGWDTVRLRHEALPDIALADVDLTTTFLGRTLRAPFVISSMTGGTDRAGEINRRLAQTAAAHGFALGLGSSRVMLEDESTLPSFDVRAIAPDIALYANLGAVQLNLGVRIDDCRRMVDRLRVDGLYLHFNPLQEALQPEGDTDFRGLLPRIAELCAALDVPVLAKSVGSGIDARTARRLADAGVAAIDVAGAGGTSWALVEGRRGGDPVRERVAEAFGGWGLATPDALADVRRGLPGIPLVASGGVRTGVHAAKAFALGADLVGLARPFLVAADAGDDALDDFARELTEALRIACFACGVTQPRVLRQALLV